MRFWSVLISADSYASERLFSHETIDVPEPPGPRWIAPGDQIVLIAAVTPPVIFALGTAVQGGGALRVAYTHRLDEPLPVLKPVPPGGAVQELSAADFAALRPPAGPRRAWLVSLDMPIEAETPAEAVRQFWTYARDLGPAELPAFVSPRDDELAIRSFVNGVEASQDPEEDE